MKLRTVDVALMGVFGALQALLSIFPLTYTIGVTGEITLGVIGGPVVGILVGPIGGLAVLIGSLVGMFLNPAGAILGVFTILPPFFGAIAAGFVKIKKGYIAGIIILISILVFYAHPFGREAFVFTWLHIVAMIVAFSPLALIAGKSFSAREPVKPVFGIIIAAFVGILTDHMIGNAIAIWYFSPILTPEKWYAILFVYPIERLVMMALTCVIAIPVYSSLRIARLIDVPK